MIDHVIDVEDVDHFFPQTKITKITSKKIGDNILTGFTQGHLTGGYPKHMRTAQSQPIGHLDCSREELHLPNPLDQLEV